MIEVGADALIKSTKAHVHLPERRIAYAGTDHLIAVTRLEFNDVPVNVITGGDTVAYSGILESDQSSAFSGTASYGTIYTGRDGTSFQGWYAIIRTPDVDDTIRITWTLIYAGGRITLTDRLTVRPQP